jgi:hypothetical protein
MPESNIATDFALRPAIVSQLQRPRIIMPTSNLLREIIAIFMHTGRAWTATVKPWSVEDRHADSATRRVLWGGEVYVQA